MLSLEDVIDHAIVRAWINGTQAQGSVAQMAGDARLDVQEVFIELIAAEDPRNYCPAGCTDEHVVACPAKRITDYQNALIAAVGRL